MYEKAISYDREVRDYAMYIRPLPDGTPELVGFAHSYHEAEIALDQLVFELLSGGTPDTMAAELNAPVICSQPDNLCDVHNPCPEHAAAAAQYLAGDPPADPDPLPEPGPGGPGVPGDERPYVLA